MTTQYPACNACWASSTSYSCYKIFIYILSVIRPNISKVSKYKCLLALKVELDTGKIAPCDYYTFLGNCPHTPPLRQHQHLLLTQGIMLAQGRGRWAVSQKRTMIRPKSVNSDSGIQEIFRVITGILDFGIRNPANDWKSQIQVPVITSIHSVQSRIKDCLGLPYIATVSKPFKNYNFIPSTWYVALLFQGQGLFLSLVL